MLSKNKCVSVKNVILCFLMLAIIVYILVWLLGLFIGYIGSFVKSPNNMDAVIIALITGGLSMLGDLIRLIVSKVIEYRQNIKRYLYEKKEEPYSECIEIVYKLQDSVRGNQEYSEKEMLDDIFSFSKKLTLWGSTKAIRKRLIFREIIQDRNDNLTDDLFILEEIMFEIRKDMGPKRMD
ncbi:hypothetical protein O6R05_02710 [Peptoniphilus equinus]|uniref:Uncharacterized protein n=1 Tax=Peptoniphilus equinus TaxID=3016343 RepID=A0ABY7QX20_9FIRM|nr:hypothetical protein [Peptoniphilus equinus]WBW50473.1 hypothetical protein O6R05_02710 [Peptoniphilus equinus]